MINSKYRNPNIFPNPFQFQVKFMSKGNNNIIFEDELKEEFVGDPAVNVVGFPSKYFVDEIKLDGIILPISTHITIDKQNKKFTMDSNNLISDNKYLALKISNLTLYKPHMIDSHLIKNNSFILIYDKPVGLQHSLWKPIISSIKFDPTYIDRLDFAIYDDKDKLLFPIINNNLIQSKCNSTNIYKHLIDSCSIEMFELYNAIQTIIFLSLNIKK